MPDEKRESTEQSAPVLDAERRIGELLLSGEASAVALSTGHKLVISSGDDSLTLPELVYVIVALPSERASQSGLFTLRQIAPPQQAGAVGS
jgi:hypothetical protein